MSFEKELKELINRNSQENESNTPDFILAKYMMDCLTAFNDGIKSREDWYGRAKENAKTPPRYEPRGLKTIG